MSAHASPSRRAGSVSAHGTGASGLPRLNCSMSRASMRSSAILAHASVCVSSMPATICELAVKRNERARRPVSQSRIPSN